LDCGSPLPLSLNDQKRPAILIAPALTVPHAKAIEIRDDARFK
jgi:hypothetical protein